MIRDGDPFVGWLWVPGRDPKENEETDHISDHYVASVPYPWADRAHFREKIAQCHARRGPEPNQGSTEANREREITPVVAALFQSERSQRNVIKDGGDD